MFHPEDFKMKRIATFAPLLAAGTAALPRTAFAICGGVCPVGDGTSLWLVLLGGGAYGIYRLFRNRAEAPPKPSQGEPTT